MARSKFGMPRAKFGEIKVKWGYEKHSGEDLFSCYGGHDDSRDHAKMMLDAISFSRYSKLYGEYKPSLLEELESRGYDITTLVFSIQKKEISSDTAKRIK